jgi:apolipoprotein N-acyltransferase
MKALPASVICLLAGAALPLAFAPFGYWYCAIPVIAILAALLERASVRQGFLYCLCFGTGFYGTGASWVFVSIHVYGYAAVPLAVLLTALFVFFLGGIFALPFCVGHYLITTWGKFHKGYLVLVFPVCWVLGEWMRSWFLTGFPWLYLGYSQASGPLAGWLPVTGVFSASFWLVFAAASLTAALSRRLFLPVIISLAAFLGGSLLSSQDWTTEQPEAVKVSLIQPNISQHEKWLPELRGKHINTLVELSNNSWQQDLVIWPEAAIPQLYQQSHDLFNSLSHSLEPASATLITGIPYRNEENNYHNSLAVLGNGSGIYHKTRLVPFGEYVPLENLLRGIIGFFDLPMSHTLPGPDHQALLKAGNISLAPFICYEIVYSNHVRHTSIEADAILTVSNDTWFGSSIGPHQHLQIAMIRAIETGRYVVRATNNGFSAIINPKGEIIARSEQFRQQVLTGEIHAVSGSTPFMQWGHWPVLVTLFALTLAYIAGCRKVID